MDNPADFQKTERSVANAILNARLKDVDGIVASSGLPALQQMGILTLATALCFRRVLLEQGITDRGRRKKLQRIAMEELGEKIAQYGFKLEAQDNGDKPSM